MEGQERVNEVIRREDLKVCQGALGDSGAVGRRISEEAGGGDVDYNSTVSFPPSSFFPL